MSMSASTRHYYKCMKEVAVIEKQEKQRTREFIVWKQEAVYSAMQQYITDSYHVYGLKNSRTLMQQGVTNSHKFRKQ